MREAPKPSKMDAAAASNAQPYLVNINYVVMCQECKEVPPNIVEEFSSGDMVCGSCGLVLGDKIIDTRSEWRTFSNDDGNNDDPSRVGGARNELLNGSQLETDIAFGVGGGAARELHKAHKKSAFDKGNKDLVEAYIQISLLGEGWNLSKSVIDSAKHHFKRVQDAGALRGKSREVIIAGCIFLACRKANVPRTFRETFNLTKVSKKEIGQVFKKLKNFIEKDDKERSGITDAGLGSPTAPAEGMMATNASALVDRYANQLLLGQRVSNVAKDIATRMNELQILAGRSPLSQAAASIYFASQLMKEPKTTAEVSRILGISDGTIRTVYKLLYGEKDRLVNPDWLRDGRGDMALLPAV